MAVEDLGARVDEDVPWPTEPPDEELYLNGSTPRPKADFVLPHDLAAEEVVLGTMMSSPSAARAMFGVVSVEDFFSETHQAVAGAVLTLLSKSSTTDPVAVWGVLADAKVRHVEQEGGGAFVATLFGQGLPQGMALHHARRVCELGRRRGVYNASASAVQLIKEGAPAGRALESLVREAALLERAVAADEARDPRAVAGGDFIFEETAQGVLWGHGESILWPTGESLMIVSPTGVGKSTLAQRVILSRIGLGPDEVLGLPVARTSKRVLYIAADRPKQIAKSFRRMVDPASRPTLDERLEVWKGPPPFKVAETPERLAPWVQEFGADTVVIDSLKDIAPGLSKDDVGGMVSQALQYLVAVDIDVLLLHHQRKAQAENRKPKAIDDVYGSGLIPYTCGSVVLLWGKPGDPIFELSQIKMAEGEVGPLTVEIDHRRGAVRVMEGSDLLALLRDATNGLTAGDGARLLYQVTDPSKSETEKARRKLNDLVDKDLAHKRMGSGRGGGRPGARPKEPDRYFATVPQQTLEEAESAF